VLAGLSAIEVGREIAKHQEHTEEEHGLVGVAAVLLAIPRLQLLSLPGPPF
jgi:hypothetical protein